MNTNKEARMATDGQAVEIALRFRVHDRDLLLRLAEEQITTNGGGHEFDPDDLADCIAELLLHSNPDIKGYLDYGIELVG